MYDLSRIKRDLRACFDADATSSPVSDSLRQITGNLYEEKLYRHLSSAGIPFRSEKELRAEGSFKTPDALLTVPIAVRR